LQQGINSTFAKIDLTGFSKRIYFAEVQTAQGEVFMRKVLKVER
jgi:hypothetical protein